MIISALKLLSILQSDVKTMGMMLELLVIKVAKLLNADRWLWRG